MTVRIQEDYIDKGLVHSVHTSSRRSFRSCRRRYDLAYRQMYYPLVTPPPLEFGVAFHAAMEEWYRPEFWQKPGQMEVALQRFKMESNKQLKRYKKYHPDPDVTILDEYRERVDLGLNMIKHYCINVSPEYDIGFTPVKVEVSFEVPVLSPTGEPIWCKCKDCFRRLIIYTKPEVNGKPCSDYKIVDEWNGDIYKTWKGFPVTYGGRLDMLAKDLLNRYWVYDWKQETVDSPILTPNGWVRMGDLKVGDFVIGSNGKKTKVIGVYPKGKHEVYEVIFRDGTIVECSKDHAWYVKDYFGKYSVKESQDILKKPTYQQYYVPLPTGPVEFEKQSGELPIHPYILGSLIGDGCFTGNILTYSSKSGETVELIKNYVRTYGFSSVKITDQRHHGANKWQITGPWKGNLIELGLWGKYAGDKFIPKEYLFSSIEDRILILQGLMDTDGNTGIYRFTSTSNQLAEDFRHLVWSLGGNAYLNSSQERIHQNEITINVPQFGVNFWLPDWIEVNQLERKKVGRVKRSKGLHRGIKEVRATGIFKDMQCIRVEAPDHLYMTNNFVLTHNTTARLLDEGKEESFLELDDQVSCVPLDTEILTKRGWKKYNELIVGEEVLGYDINDESTKWTILEDIHLYYDKAVNRYYSKSFEFVSTTNHKWVTGTSNELPEQLIPFKNKVHYYLKFADPDGFTNPKPSDISSNEAALIAWILSDGHLSYHNRTWVCSISQKKYVGEVQVLLNSFDNCYSRIEIDKTGTHVWHLRAPFVRDYLWHKAKLDLNLNGWENFILSLSDKARQAFCEASYLAEGATGRNIFHQKDGLKKDIFRLAFFLNGTFPTKGTSKYFVPGKPYKWTHGIKEEVLPNRTDVWCPQTGTRTWIMRQNGQIAITGNSYLWALDHYDVKTAGFVYVEIKKEYPKPPKELSRPRLGCLYSKDKMALTTYDIARKTFDENDHEAFTQGLYEDYLNWLRSDGPRFTQRHQIHKNAHEIAEIGHNIYLEAIDMIDNPRIYPTPGRFSCPSCMYRQVCLGMNQGEDYEYTLRSLFEKKEKHYYEEQAASTE